MLQLLVGLSAISAVFACPQHDISLHSHEDGILKRAESNKDWTYEASYNWGMINPDYKLCQTGTMQAPIHLMITQGLSLNHIPTFNYGKSVAGNVHNWGYGPAFTLNTTDYSTHPSVSYDNETVYLKGWHIHAPADHSVQGDRSKAELHLVHSDAEGHEKAVLAIRIDPGNKESAFTSQFINAVPNFDNTTAIPMELNIDLALQEAAMFNEFWTYEGSLTSPPCTEGIRWFVARNVMFVSVEQMQTMLGVSTFSSRVEQEVWMHQINV